MSNILMLITKLCSHVWGEAAGSCIPAPPGTALQWCRAFLSTRSHKRLRGFLKNPLLLFPKRPVNDELKSQTEIALRLHWKYTKYALHRGRSCTYAWGTGIWRIFALFFEQKRGGHDILSAGSCIFFFLSDFSCKYIITVNTFNTYTASKAAQSCSYCMC